jgi:SAM-dependent methyltransferase
MNNNFKHYSKYYNLLYQDKDYSAEVNYVSNQLEKYSRGAKNILEFGSGTGGHGLLLQQKGYNVYGLERSEGMVSIAKQNGFNCQVADITNFTLLKTYDAVISLFHVVSYLTDNNDLIKAFINAHKHLGNGGLFLFDVWYSPAVYEQKAQPRIKRMQNSEIKVTRFAEPIIDINKNVVDVRFTVFAKDNNTNEIFELIESHPMRHFSIPEVDLIARHTGFELMNAEEFLTGNQPSQQTWGVCFTLKKK